MYRVNIERHFDAAHFLRGYQGKCEGLHGHRYRVSACLRAGKTDEVGMAYDFTGFKKQLETLLERFDHTCLNDAPPFDSQNPSAENIARTVFEDLKGKVERSGIKLESVTVWESPDSWVEYRPD